MPEPEKPEIAPPETLMSDSAKLEEVSERVKLRAAVSPAFREVTSELTAMVGLMVSTKRVTMLLASEPSLLVLPAESENLAEATEITALLVLLVLGVKVAE